MDEGWVQREKLQQKVLNATMSGKCYRITSDGSTEVQELQCQQEEADGRLLLHAAHAAEEGYEGVVVCSEDTFVFIMALAFHDRSLIVPEIWHKNQDNGCRYQESCCQSWH